MDSGSQEMHPHFRRLGSNLLTRDSKIVFLPARVGNHKVAAFCNWF